MGGRLFVRHGLFLATLLGLAFLDLWSKNVVFETLRDYPFNESDVWPGVLKFKLVKNPGMMWGMAQDVSANWWVIIRGCVLLGLFFIYARTPRKTRWTQLAFGLVGAGAIGNISDNLFQADGKVRDFLHFYWFEFPTFNVADSCICVGAPLLMIILWRQDSAAARENAAESDGSV